MAKQPKPRVKTHLIIASSGRNRVGRRTIIKVKPKELSHENLQLL